MRDGDHRRGLARLALGRFVRQFTNFNRSASNARDTFPSRQGDIDAVVFSGGGARCFRQAGFRQTVQAALPRPDVVAAVNGGAGLVALLPQISRVGGEQQGQRASRRSPTRWPGAVRVPVETGAGVDVGFLLTRGAWMELRLRHFAVLRVRLREKCNLPRLQRTPHAHLVRGFGSLRGLLGAATQCLDGSDGRVADRDQGSGRRTPVRQGLHQGHLEAEARPLHLRHRLLPRWRAHRRRHPDANRIGYVRMEDPAHEPGERIEIIGVDGKTYPAECVEFPFYDREKKTPRGLESTIPSRD